MYLGDKELDNSINQFEVVGTVSEFNLTVKQNTQKVVIDDEEKEINSAIIYGTVVVEVNGNAIKTQVLTNKFTKGGDERKQFKGLCTVAGVKYDKDTYTFGDRPLVPSISGKTTILYRDNTKDEKEFNGVAVGASRVRISGQTDRNTYLNKDASDIVVSKQLTVGSISTENVSAEDKATFDIGGCIMGINDEYDGNGATTGRKLVDIMNIGFFGGNLFTLVIPKEWTIDDNEEEVTLTPQDFIDFAKVGQTITAHGDIEGHTFGRVVDTSEKKTFGKKSDIKGGFTVIEWTLKGGDLEAPYDIEDIKQVKHEYDIYLDQDYKNKLDALKEKENKKSNSTQKKGLGARSTTKVDADNPFASVDEENPFL